MTLPTKIVVIGAGSASFGENTLAAILRSRKLRGSSLTLVDRNNQSLDIILRLANRLNDEWDAGFSIEACNHHKEALREAEFVVSAIEVGPREKLWKSDFEIPLKHGVRQPYAENGGPGGFVHAARNITPVMEIVHEMEQVCPNAWFINFTNPMTRICDAINRFSKIKVVGLCHQIFIGYAFVGLVLANELGIRIPDGLEGMHADLMQHVLREQIIQQTIPRVDILAAGLNHFTWMLALRNKQTGEDLYPLFRERFAAFDPTFEPLTREIFEDFGLFPVPGDTHLSEYLPWMSDMTSKPWEKYNIRLYDWESWAGFRDFSLDRLNDMAEGHLTIEGLSDTDSEGALEMIENIAAAGTHYHLAANRPNSGQIPNLPNDAIVETPVQVDGDGIHPVQVGPLPEAVAELCRREIAVGQLGVDAVIEGNPEKALQCLLLDPVITDIELAKDILADYLKAYREHLPQFWD
jgi:alpha-galactosidase